ncbi:MAG: SDR family NAD(P)-dependent oxidoreductase [Myxococcota bacterium]
MLNGKVAVVFGAGGQIGSHACMALAKHGATVFASGRRIESVNRTVDAIQRAGGAAEAAEVDALSDKHVDDYIAGVVERAGAVHVVFNAMGAPMERGEELVCKSTELSSARFSSYMTHSVVSQFLTARAAARHMLERKAGVVILLGATPSTGLAPFVAGAAAAHAAIEGLTRCLATEWSPAGVRVACVRASGVQETRRIQLVRAAMARVIGIPEEQFESVALEKALLRRSLRLSELSELVAFLASDTSASLTGTILNASCGEVMDR